MKRGFRFQWLALCVVIAVCSATAAAGGAGAGPTARERAREVRLREAEMQFHLAAEALETERRMVSEGLRPGDQLGERELELMRARYALDELEATEAGRVSIDVRNEKLTAVFTKLFEGTEQSLMLDPAVADIASPVTLTLNDVSLESAVRAICKLYNLDYETDKEGLWVIMPSSGFATVGGERVRVLGAAAFGGPTTTVGRGPGDSLSIVTRSGGEPYAFSSTGEARPTKLTEFPGSHELIDLDVRDAPLAEVTAELDKLLAASSKEASRELEIIVHDSVPNDLKVTARIYKMRLMDILHMLVDQANLTYVKHRLHPAEYVEERDRHGTLVQRRVERYQVHIVPRPELRVSGPGVGDEMTILGRYLQSGSSEAARLRTEDARTLAEEVRRQMAISTAGGGKVSILRSCPQCDATVLLPDWKFCPYCGAEAVAEKEQPEGAD